MEIVNKIQIRLDTLISTATTINVPFGLDFFPVDNCELQETEFVELEKEKAINPIFDAEKYPYFPTYPTTTQLNTAYTVEYSIDKNLSFLELTNEDIVYNRKALRKTYLRLNFYNSPDTKVHNLIAREVVPLGNQSNWYQNGELLDQSIIPLKFIATYENLIYLENVNNGALGVNEGYHFYWHKTDLPTVLYVKASIMNAKTGKVIDLYSKNSGPIIPNPNVDPSLPVMVTSGGYDYIQCRFFFDQNKRQQYYYIFNDNNLSKVTNTGDPLSPVESINNKIIVNLFTY